jgi:hypothetical protein
MVFFNIYIKVCLLVVIISTLFLSCVRNQPQQASSSSDVVMLKEINLENSELNTESTKAEGEAHSGKYFSSIDSIKQYGAGYLYCVNDTLKNKNLSIYISCWVRESDLPFEGGIAVSVTNKDGSAGWKTFELKTTDCKAGTWIQLKDSVFFASDIINKENTEVRIFGFKPNGKDKFDLDDLQIRYKFSKK